MKAISIGFSTEDATLFLDRLDPLEQYEFLAQVVDAATWAEPRDLTSLLEELDAGFKERLDVATEAEDLKNWNSNMAEFKKEVEGQQGAAFGWSVEYDDNVMFVFDTTIEDVKILEVKE